MACSTAALVEHRQHVPGSAMSTAEAWVFGGAPNAVEAPENMLALGEQLRVRLDADDDFPLHGKVLATEGTEVTEEPRKLGFPLCSL